MCSNTVRSYLVMPISIIFHLVPTDVYRNVTWNRLAQFDKNWTKKESERLYRCKVHLRLWRFTWSPKQPDHSAFLINVVVVECNYPVVRKAVICTMALLLSRRKVVTQTFGNGCLWTSLFAMTCLKEYSEIDYGRPYRWYFSIYWYSKLSSLCDDYSWEDRYDTERC